MVAGSSPRGSPKPLNTAEYTRRSYKASAFGMIHGGILRIRSQPPNLPAVCLLDTNFASMPHICELCFETPWTGQTTRCKGKTAGLAIGGAPGGSRGVAYAAKLHDNDINSAHPECAQTTPYSGTIKTAHMKSAGLTAQ